MRLRILQPFVISIVPSRKAENTDDVSNIFNNSSSFIITEKSIMYPPIEITVSEAEATLDERILPKERLTVQGIQAVVSWAESLMSRENIIPFINALM